MKSWGMVPMSRRLNLTCILIDTRINPLTSLVNVTLPMFAEDAHDMIVRIIQHAKDKGEEVGIEDGFDLYKELSEVRRVYTEALPGYVNPNQVS